MRFPRSAFLIALCALLVHAPVCPAEQVKLPNDIAWVKLSDCYKACVLQAWLGAGMRLRELAKAERPGAWCVVVDADETIISNLTFQEELAVTGARHSSGAWDAWCNRAEATALPGAKEYCALVRELGGRLLVVTNREADTKAATLKNMDALGFAYDAVLFREGPYARDRDKTERRGDIEKGAVKTLPPGKTLPPMKILMLGGDQIHDLYDDGKLSFDQVKDRFARDLVMIPNPMYGDWTRNAYVAAPEPKAARPAARAAAPEPEPGEPWPKAAESATGASGAGAKSVEPAAAPGKAQSAPGVLTPTEAKGKMGETVTVEAVVDNVRVRERGPISLNFDRTPREGLSVVIFDKEAFGDVKAKYEGKKIRVRGEVSDYRGAAQIKVTDPAQIEVVP